MKRNNHTIETYKAVLTLHKVGGFRLAAQELKLSASALSRLISRLEDEIGSKLFDRDTRNVTITSQGKAFIRMAEQIINVSTNAELEFNAFLAARSGKLTIAGLPSLTAGLIPPLLRQFSEKNPNIDVNIMDILSIHVVQAVLQNKADLGLTSGTIDTREQVSFLPLTEDEFVAVGNANGYLKEERTYNLSELISQPFIAMSPGSGVRDLVNAACMQMDLSFTPRYEVSHLATAGALISEGLGISVLPTMTLPVLGASNIVCRPISNFSFKRRIGVIWRSGKNLSPAATEFLKIVRNTNFSSKSKPVNTK